MGYQTFRKVTLLEITYPSWKGTQMNTTNTAIDKRSIAAPDNRSNAASTCKAEAGRHWCAIYGNAMSITDHRVETYSKDLTLRYPVKVPFAGSALRFTFDNFCGTESITISAAFVAMTGNTPESIIKETSRQITFDGNVSITIPAGKRILSDPIPFPVSQGDSVSVSFYLKEFTLMRSGVIATGPFSKGFYSVHNHSTAEVLPLNETRKTNCFYFLSDISLYTDSCNHAVICYGDSITSQDWPDYMLAECLKLPDNHTAIIRKAASGTRILRQYDNITYESYGLMGKVRFPHELPVAGADTIIIQQGINDIIHPVGTDVNPFRPMSDLPTIDELTEGLIWYIQEARKLCYHIFMGTLLPIEGWRTYAPFRETLKNQVNDFIRSTDLIDTCIDFDKEVRDPAHPAAFRAGYDSGDHLHPSAAAYEAMGRLAFRSL